TPRVPSSPDNGLNQRLMSAFQHPADLSHNENLKKTLVGLLRHGLVVHINPAQTSHVPLASASSSMSYPTSMVAPVISPSTSPSATALMSALPGQMQWSSSSSSSATSTALMPTNGTAHRIADTLLNFSTRKRADKRTYPSPYKPLLRLGPGITSPNFPVPTGSRLLLWCLAQKLHINIFLFSTRSKPHFFGYNGLGGTNTSIGFLHHVDSFHGTSEYLVLGHSRTPPVPGILQPVQPVQPTLYHSSVPPASIRVGRARRTTRLISNISRDVCDEAITAACTTQLKEMLANKAKEVVKKIPKSDRKARKESGLAYKQELLDKKALPRNTKEEAVRTMRRNQVVDDSFDVQNLTYVQQRVGGNNIAIWTEVVEDKFSGFWREALETADKEKEKQEKQAKEKQKGKGKKKDDGGDGGDGTDDEAAQLAKDKESLRTCSVTLQQILRPDLKHQFDAVRDSIESKQIAITDDMTELSILLQKAVVVLAGGNLHGGQWSTTGPTALDVAHLLPNQFRARNPAVQSVLQIGQIPDGLQASLETALETPKAVDNEESDLALLHSHKFLQYIHTSFLGATGNTSASKLAHPLWERIAVALQASSPPNTKAPSGLSSTITESIRELSIAFTVLWEGSIYTKLLDYLLRILLRLHLAPIREQAHRDRMKKIAVRKQEAADKKQKEAEEATKEKILSRRKWLTKATILCDGLSDVLEAGQAPMLQKRLPALFGMLNKLLEKEPSSGTQTKLPSIEAQLNALSTSSSTSAVAPPSVPSTAPAPIAQDDDIDEDDEDDSDNDSLFDEPTGAHVIEEQ
ncbi:hypothetical protein BGZ68_002894, partial [Mortierella alpina]